MKKIRGAMSVLSMTVALVLAQSTPSFADVVVNNVLSPFTAIQVGPGYGYVHRYDYYGAPRYHSEPAYPTYYERPHHYYRERPSYHRSGYHRGHSWHGYCWVVTDRDRGYGYWGRCH